MLNKLNGVNDKLLVSLICCVVSTSALAESFAVRTMVAGEKSPAAKIEQLAWLTGVWQGEGLGGQSEEVIAEAKDHQMMGMFRQTDKDGSLMFYEFYLFSEVEGSLILRIKHFAPNLHGWEKQNDYKEFPLVAIEGKAAYFDGLTYALGADGHLHSVVRVDEQGDMQFKFARGTLDKEL